MLPNGVNKRICEKLGLDGAKVLVPKTSPKSGVIAGSGMVGALTKPMTEATFLNKVKKVMKARSVRYTKLSGKKVSKVAVCGGSGSFLLEAAIASGADVFLTSDFKYHQFFDADNKVVIVDIGHYESEQYTPELIRDLLKQKFGIFATHLSKVNTNPVNYL